ncbi:hypothetical protein BHM03_00048861, partial [Ensete ventricosum]
EEDLESGAWLIRAWKGANRSISPSTLLALFPRFSRSLINCHEYSLTSVQLRNIVSTVNLDCKLDLKAIALQARNAEYNPKVWNNIRQY